MPNIKSAIKRVAVNVKKNKENKMIKSKLNTEIKKFKKALADKDLQKAEELLKETVTLLDKSAKASVIHKNNASKKQAHFAKMLSDAKIVK